jgi:hypothetical protein
VSESLCDNEYLDHGIWFGKSDPLWWLDSACNGSHVVSTLQRQPA